ncbi:MAG: GNAT family N-acetyltransferase [Chloroflexota bacterium]
MRIVPVTDADIDEYRTLPVDLDYEDYVIASFADLVAAAGFYKAVDDNGVMLAVARNYPVVGGYAYLGSARTGVPYRGRGIATAMARFLIDDLRRRGFTWVGLSTDDTNVPVHRSMEKVGLRRLGEKAFVVVKAGGLAQFLRANGIDVPTATSGREVTERAEKIDLMRSMLASARNREHGPEQLAVLSCGPFVILPPHADLVELTADWYRLRVAGGQPYLLRSGTTEGWDWTEASFYGGDLLRHPAVLADLCAVAPADRELWLLTTPAGLASIDRDSADWSGVLRLYGAEL